MKPCRFAEKVVYCHLQDQYVDPADCWTCTEYDCKGKEEEVPNA